MALYFGAVLSERCSLRGEGTSPRWGALLLRELGGASQLDAAESSGSGKEDGASGAGDIYRSDTSSGVGAVVASCLSDCSSCGADSRRAVGVASARDYAAEENYRCEGGGCSYSYRCEDAVALAPLLIKSHLLPVPQAEKAAERPSVSCP